MPARSSRIERINTLIQQMNTQEQSRQGMELGIKLSNELMLHFGMPEQYVRDTLDVLDDAFANSEFSNQKMETWFYKHPILGNARIALHHVQVPELAYESQFYMLSDELSKARVAATANLFSHWEDSELTKFPTYKVGLHFFVSYDGRTFYLVLTKDTNIRLLELNERLSNTQSNILENLKNVLSYQSNDENEPQQTIHAQLWKALELSEVNKRFYEGVADAFMVLVQHLHNNDYEKKEAQLFSSRLLGRLIFIWFLRKKDIIHESMGYFDPMDLNSTDYYNKKLKPLFFDALNTPMEQRKHTDIITPYLNGGLFEAHENDWIQQSIPFPIDWFNQLYDHLNKFNFTTDESTPEYEQVAIDPEMLGRVFENLLATVVPETSNAANDRKNKGAFYTPREIVSFMTKETLKQYLKTKIINEKHHFGIDQLIDMNDAKFLEQKSTGDIQIWGNSSKEVQEKIIVALDSIKVLDPACGSGAFPIGMMQLLSQTYERIQAFYVQGKKSHRLAQASERFNSYQTKLHIIQSSLFGSDIEPMAIEIARLRTWLSLIIEDMSKIEPLPNLDFNFVCANSLIPLEKDEQISIFDDTEYEERLAELREEFFSSHEINNKLKLKQRFIDLYDEKLHSSDNSKRINQLRTWNPFIASEPAEFFDAKVMFNTNGFDVVIGNPPYIHLESIKELSKNLYKPLKYKTYAARGDIYTLFYEMGVSNLRPMGLLIYITSSKWMRATYGDGLRNYLIEYSNPKLLIDLGSGVFESATVDTNILMTTKEEYSGKTNAITLTNLKKSTIQNQLKEHTTSIKFNKDSNWAILSPIEQSIIDKVDKFGTPFKIWNKAKISYGIKTGLNEAFIIDENKRTEIIMGSKTSDEEYRTNKLIRPIIRGKDISFNKVTWSGLYVILAHYGIHKILEASYGSLYEYLFNMKGKLEQRGQCRYTSSGKKNDKSDENYPGYPGMHHWLELDNNISESNLSEFLETKIIYPNMTTDFSFILDKSGYFTNEKCFIITGENLETLNQYLNSDIFKLYAKNTVPKLGNNGYELRKVVMITIPLPINNHGLIINDDYYDFFKFSKKEIEYLKIVNH